MNLVTFKSINVERLEFIKSVSLRLFCVNTQGYLILASCVLFSFSEGPTFASHMGETVSAGIVLFSCSVSAWRLLLETRRSTSADSLLSHEAWHCDSVASSVHSWFSPVSLQLLLKALLSPFYSLITSHFDLLSFVITACEKMISQLASLDIQKILGSLMYLKEF